MIHKKLIIIASVLLLLQFYAKADVGSSYVVKARIKVGLKEYIGYFDIWGYISIEKDSLTFWRTTPTRFATKIKGWMYTDTLRLHADIIQEHDQQLLFFPIGKVRKILRSDIQEIYPMDLFTREPGRGSSSPVISSDGEWLNKKIHSKDSFGITDDLCSYEVLYYVKPDKSTLDIVKALQNEMKNAFSGVNTRKRQKVILEQLCRRKVIVVYYNCFS